MILFILLGSLSLYSNNSYGSLKKANYYYKLKKVSEKKKLYLVVRELVRARYYFSAVYFMKEYLAETDTINEKAENLLERLLLHAGPEAFDNLDLETLYDLNSPTLKLLLANRFFNQQKYEKAQEVLSKIPQKSKHKAEAFFLTGTINKLNKNYSNALTNYVNCKKHASKWSGKASLIREEKFFEQLRDNCQIHIARTLYKQGEYKKALKQYDLIPKTNYMWPFLLYEKAWANYYLQDYNRTLGLLVTYKSPLLKNYFLPGSEVLSSLAYYRLCLWQDSYDLVKRFHKVYAPKSQELKKVLLENKNSKTFFLNLVFSKKKSTNNLYVNQLATQIKRKIKFSNNLLAFKKARNELKYVKKKKYKLFRKIRTELGKDLVYRRDSLNHYIKKMMFTFINDIHRFSHEMFNIKIELMANQRNLIYKDKKLVKKNRTRGSLKTVKRASNEYFWKFKGGFWADELGDYSFALESSCKEISTKTKKRRR